MLELISGLHTPNFDTREEKIDYLQTEVFRKDKHARDAVIPLMNGGMSVDITGTRFVEAMAAENLIGVYGASLPGWRDIQEFEKGLSISERKELTRQANKKAIESASSFFRERCNNAIVGANLLRILKDYEGTREDLIKSGQFDILFVGAGLPDDLPERMAQDDCKNMFYVPIVSSATVAKFIRRKKRELGKAGKKYRQPDAIYLELPNEAGGHLGAKNIEQAQDDSLWDPVKICDEIWKVFPNTPIIIAGGIGYKDQIIHAYDIANGASMGTRFLLTQESGMPNNIIEEKYLNKNIPVVVDEMSSTGYASRRLDIPVTERTEASIREAIRNCVSCVCGNKNECKYLLQANKIDPDYPNYCIRRELIKTRNGIATVCFTGRQIEKFRYNKLYRGKNGELYVPTVKETIEFLLSNNSVDSK
ncbi:MAG: nitronate monooxygenase [Candidatus Peribacteraceae bacterium]|nr:nitronate monooxygenase [Candidatus Peribacteraceae bacterium]